MVEIKPKAMLQRMFPKGKGVRKAKREKRMVETKAKARHQRKAPMAKGVRKERKENGRDQGKGIRERLPKERVYEKQRERKRTVETKAKASQKRYLRKRSA